MNINSTFITGISNFMHILTGAALFVFAGFEVLAALKPKIKVPAIGGFLLFCSGVCALLFMFDKTGGTPEAAVQAMSKASILFLFAGLGVLLSASGLIGVMQYLSKNMPSFWKLFQMLLFCFVAAVFYLYPQFYKEGAQSVFVQIHRVICYSMAAGAVIAMLNVFIRSRIVAFISVFCFFITGSLLVQFKEEPSSFTSRQEFTSSMPASPGEVHFEEIEKNNSIVTEIDSVLKKAKAMVSAEKTADNKSGENKR